MTLLAFATFGKLRPLVSQLFVGSPEPTNSEWLPYLFNPAGASTVRPVLRFLPAIFRISLCGALSLLFAGCAHWSGTNVPNGLPVGGLIANPLPVAVADEEYLWNQIVDTVDDYFKIKREVRMRSDGGIVTDGLIETLPVTGATYLEPWRRDSTPGFERLHASLQSVRRRATVRVVPFAGGYSIDLAVYKELEDVAQPEQATVGAATLRHDGSLVRNEPNPLGGPPTLGWIPLCRDITLEQRMLSELSGRLAEVPEVKRLPGI